MAAILLQESFSTTRTSDSFLTDPSSSQDPVPTSTDKNSAPEFQAEI